MFCKILHANDGSEHAFLALTLALAIAKQNNSELHMVSVKEIDYMPEFLEEIREETGTAARRFHGVLQRARAMAEESKLTSWRGIRCATSSSLPPISTWACSLLGQEATLRCTSDWLGAALIVSCTLLRARCSS
jgi:hypothetical protein